MWTLDHVLRSIRPQVLAVLRRSRFEFARSNYDPAVLAIAKGRIVMFGCVDPSDTPVPPVAQVVERVRTALKYIEPNNLWLAPDCGLMTISRDLASAKAKLLVDAAAELRKSI